METYGIVVCENDQVQLKNLHGFVNRAVWSLEDSPDSKDKTCEVVLVTTSYQEVVNYLNNTYIDSGVYFLDIDLGKDDGQNGIDLAEFIKSKDLNAQIIFITAYENFAAMTYRRRIGAVDFITKTELDQKRLNEALFLAIKRIRELHTVREQTFSYKMGRRLINQNIRDILYIVTISGCPSTDMDDPYSTSYRNVGSVFLRKKTGMAFPSIPESVHPPFLKKSKIMVRISILIIGNLVVFPQPHFFIHNHLTY